MNYIKEATEYLNSFEDLKAAEKNLEENILEIEEELTSVREVCYSGMPHGSNLVNADDRLVNKLYSLEKYKHNLDRTRKAKEKIILSLSRLPDYERNLLTYYYIDGLRDISLYEKLKCSERKFYTDKAKILKKFAIQLFGIEVIN